ASACTDDAAVRPAEVTAAILPQRRPAARRGRSAAGSYCGRQALMLQPVTPLHWRADRQSPRTVQILRQGGAAAGIRAQNGWSGQPLVEPGVEQLLVQ